MTDLTGVNARKYFVTFPTDREDRLIVARTPKDAAREVFTTVPEAFAAGMVKVDPAHFPYSPQTRFYQSTTYGGAEVLAATASEYYAAEWAHSRD